MELPDKIKKRLEEVSVREGSNLYETEEELKKIEDLIEVLRETDLELDFSKNTKYQDLIKKRETLLADANEKMLRVMEDLKFRLFTNESVLLVNLQVVELEDPHPMVIDKNDVVWSYDEGAMRYKPLKNKMSLRLVKEYEDAGLL